MRPTTLGTQEVDRPDLQFSAKEACPSMTKPMEKDWVPLKRLARYMIRAPELVVEYGFVGSADDGGEVVHTVVDWGSCGTTCRSLSGRARIAQGNVL